MPPHRERAACCSRWQLCLYFPIKFPGRVRIMKMPRHTLSDEFSFQVCKIMSKDYYFAIFMAQPVADVETHISSIVLLPLATASKIAPGHWWELKNARQHWSLIMRGAVPESQPKNATPRRQLATRGVTSYNATWNMLPATMPRCYLGLMPWITRHNTTHRPSFTGDTIPSGHYFID